MGRIWLEFACLHLSYFLSNVQIHHYCYIDYSPIETAFEKHLFHSNTWIGRKSTSPFSIHIQIGTYKKNPEIETWKLLRRIDRTLPEQKHGDLFLIVPSFINNEVTKSVKSLKCYYSLSSILDIDIRCGNNPAWWSLSLKILLYLTILHYNQ